MTASASAPAPAPVSLTVRITGDVDIQVPADVAHQLTSYVLLEQEDWFEPERAFLERLLQPGWNVIDAGAGYGVYALSLAKRLQTLGHGGQVLALEPAEGPAALLAQSIAANQLSERLSLRRLALDALLDDPAWPSPDTRIDLLKLDLGGHEDPALAGAERLLREDDPLILFDAGSAKTADSPLRQRLERHGYRCYRLIPGLDALAPLDPARPLDAFDINLFACKPSRAAELRDLGRLLEHPLGAQGQPPPPPRHWSEALAAYPYVPVVTRTGQTLRGWAELERGTDPYWADYEQALNAYLSASDPKQPLPARAAWLDQALRGLQRLHDEGDDHLLTRSLHLRVLAAAGERQQAANLAQQLTALEATRPPVRLDRPFLPPCPDYDQRLPVNLVKDWYSAAIRESAECLAYFAGHFDPDIEKTQERIAPLLDNPNCGMVIRHSHGVSGIVGM